MKKVSRKDILPIAEYNGQRDSIRQNIMKIKADRRIHIGDHFTFLFENFETMSYQIQEMIRAEGREDETEIMHEIETYNELLGDKGELACTLLIEIDDPQKRDQCLTRWQKLPSTIFIETEKGDKIPARFDDRQIAERRISSVQYLKFAIGDQIPKAVGIDLDEVRSKATLSTTQRTALIKDLIS